MSLKEKVGRSFSTITEMLTDRNILSDEQKEMLRSFSQNELQAFSGNANFNIDIGNIRIIYFTTKFKIGDFKPYLDVDKDKDKDKDKEKDKKKRYPIELYIVVVADKLTALNMKSINIALNDLKLNIEEKYGENDERPKPVIQCFELAEVMSNITKHVLVPKHEIIDDEAVINTLVEKYNIKTKTNFPLILKTDPIARYYGIKPGSLVKVTRVSPSAGEYTIYRCCV